MLTGLVVISVTFGTTGVKDGDPWVSQSRHITTGKFRSVLRGRHTAEYWHKIELDVKVCKPVANNNVMEYNHNKDKIQIF